MIPVAIGPTELKKLLINVNKPVIKMQELVRRFQRVPGTGTLHTTSRTK